jgi:PIN domain nuclease of toxin-antitoxin system
MPAAACSLILDTENHVFVSAASIWEIAIKHSISRRSMPVSVYEALGYFRESGDSMIPVTAAHAALAETLAPHHKDPFARLQIARATLEPLRLLTHDRFLAKYGDTILLV